ncbi:hypothetical protein LTR56_008821 [Elasticomyces elasticus]|nr:hypothetical protein LTR22_021722 [Elasticomyces elasticus]KAK3645943.1 hypothetical protein LTR56_008821 [Elasticomyces elasticus]KAK4928105.1 hypothetical protein LTR49_005043 [Elasticomyces elasticus]KAK5765858.1 hypothetical protein LTS12_003865 [Elasticomyces elasticus]
MIHLNQIDVRLREHRGSFIPEFLNTYVTGLDLNKHSVLICDRTAQKYRAWVRISEHFELHGADGIVLSISEGQKDATAENDMTNTQILYVPYREDGTIAGEYEVEGFRRWSRAGRDEFEELAMPRMNGDCTHGGALYGLRDCANGHYGAVTITIQRVKFEKRCTDYIIRRSYLDYDTSTIPPECYRTAPRSYGRDLRVINRHWVTPLAGEQGKPIIFEFMNSPPEIDPRQALRRT